MALSPNAKLRLAELAKQGDMVAQALSADAQDIVLTAGVEAANVITVTGQIVDGLGTPIAGVQNVVVTSIPVSGAGTMTAGGTGTVKAGSASKEVWIQTDATGKFSVGVLNVAVEDNLVRAVTANGEVAMLKLTYA